MPLNNDASGGNADIYDKEALGGQTLPVRLLFNNYGGCMQATITNRVEMSVQSRFEAAVNERDLFKEGSVIIAFHYMNLNKGHWRLNTYTVDLPGGCLSWMQSVSKDFAIYKYTKVRKEDAIRETNGRESRTREQPEKIKFVNYLED